MRVVDIFRSIQGEGLAIGKTASFLQLEGCNMEPPCLYCDQSVLLAPGINMSVSEVAEKLQLKNVVVFGGEPLLQASDLLELFALLPDRFIELETNASIYDERLVSRVDLWSLSPRLASSGHHPNREVILEFLAAVSVSRLQFKFSIRSDEDLNEAWQLVEDLRLYSSNVILQPPEMVSDPIDAYCKLIASVLRERGGFWSSMSRLRILPRLNVLAWHRRLAR